MYHSSKCLSNLFLYLSKPFASTTTVATNSTDHQHVARRFRPFSFLWTSLWQFCLVLPGFCGGNDHVSHFLTSSSRNKQFRKCNFMCEFKTCLACKHLICVDFQLPCYFPIPQPCEDHMQFPTGCSFPSTLLLVYSQEIFLLHCCARAITDRLKSTCPSLTSGEPLMWALTTNTYFLMPISTCSSSSNIS